MFTQKLLWFVVTYSSDSPLGVLERCWRIESIFQLSQKQLGVVFYTLFYFALLLRKDSESVLNYIFHFHFTVH